MACVAHPEWVAKDRLAQSGWPGIGWFRVGGSDTEWVAKDKMVQSG